MPVQILGADLSLQEAQHILAKEYGFTSWKQLTSYVEVVNKPPMVPDAVMEAIDAAVEAHKNVPILMTINRSQVL